MIEVVTHKTESSLFAEVFVDGNLYCTTEDAELALSIAYLYRERQSRRLPDETVKEWLGRTDCNHYELIPDGIDPRTQKRFWRCGQCQKIWLIPKTMLRAREYIFSNRPKWTGD